MVRLSIVIAVGLGIVFFVGGCGEGNSCDCQPTITFSSPSGSNALTEFNDQDLTTIGLQYGVVVQTTCIAVGQKLILTNDKNPGGDVEGTVATDDSVGGTGYKIDFGNQTFQNGINKLCITGDALVDHKSDLTMSCSAKKRTVNSCKNVNVELNVPACLFEIPSDNATLTAADDSNTGAEGFQTDVRAVCKGVDNNTVVKLIVNGSMPVEATLASGTAIWTDATLAEGPNVLTLETTGIDSNNAPHIAVTVNTGNCVVRLSPPTNTSGTAFTSSDATITVETDAAGIFSCADGSIVSVHIRNPNYEVSSANYQGTFYGTLVNYKAEIKVTLYQGDNQVYAEIQDSTNQRFGRSLVNQYSVSLITPYVLVADPLDSVRFGHDYDKSLAPGFQYGVKCQFTGAAVGDMVDLYRQVEGTDLTMVFVDSHSLLASELSDYTFPETTTLSPDPATAGRVLVRCVISRGGVTNDNIVSITINLESPDVTITRPGNGNLNMLFDMCSQGGFQTQVDVQTYKTTQGDPLILCVCSGTCIPDLNSTDRCTQMGYGTTRKNTTVSGVTTILSCIPFEQGDNTLRAFAENAPNQGTYSGPVVVHVDSVPPTVVSITTNANQDGCITQVGAPIVNQVVVDDPGKTADLTGRTVNIINGWPGTGAYVVAHGVISSGGVVNITNDVTLGDGIYNLTATFTDAFENWNIRNTTPITYDPEAQFTLKVDTQAPTISITSPIKSILNSPEVTFSVSTTGVEDGQSVTFTYGSEHTPINVVAGAASIALTLVDGSYTLQASVSDACGNTASSAPKVIQVDTTKPGINSCSAPVIENQKVTFQCNTRDPNLAQTVKVASAIGNCQSNVTSNSSGDISFDCLFQNGTADLSITLTDPAGNISDPFTIGITISVPGCTIAFQGVQPVMIYKASDDKDTGTAGLQTDLTVHSNNCNSTNCPNCKVVLKNQGSDVNPPGIVSLDSSGTVLFSHITLADNSRNVIMSVEIDDNSGHILSDSFTVQLVKLSPPVLVQLAPGDNTIHNVTCVASSGNPDVDGKFVLADKIADTTACDMDFQFSVTDGGDATYPGSLTINLGVNVLGGPIAIENNPQIVDFTNLPLPNNASNHVVITATDYAGNETPLEMIVTTDTIPPSVINATAALDSNVQASRHADVNLNWLAVGDDENVGIATGYDLRWSRNPIVTEADWNLATPVTAIQSKVPAAPDGAETYLAQWLPPLNTYHLALRAVDEVGNEGPIPEQDVKVENNWNLVKHTGPAANFGYSLFNLGDVNGDHRQELAVGAPTYSSNKGALYLFYGAEHLSDWHNESARHELTRGADGELFGFEVSVGDLDGDKTPDLVVSGYGFQSGRGRVSIYFGRPGAYWPTTPDIELRSAVGTTGTFGRSIEVIGDINHDGYDDLFISAPTLDVNGRGFIFFGRPRTGVNSWTDTTNYATGNDGDGYSYVPAAAANIKILGKKADDWFGYRHGNTSMGDLDGDGYADVALVASGINTVYTFSGAVLSTLTTGDVDPDTATKKISDGSTLNDSAKSGFGIRSVGGYDFTGDGLLDLLVSDSRLNSVYLFASKDYGSGNPSVWIDDSSFEKITWNESIYFGWSLDAGDINLDGCPDIIVGNSLASGSRAFIYFNNGASPFFASFDAVTQKWISEPGTILSGTELFGMGVVIGDFDGNGLPDIAVTSREATVGMLYVYY
jgi:hypothetical protein